MLLSLPKDLLSNEIMMREPGVWNLAVRAFGFVFGGDYGGEVQKAKDKWLERTEGREAISIWVGRYVMTKVGGELHGGGPGSAFTMRCLLGQQPVICRIYANHGRLRVGSAGAAVVVKSDEFFVFKVYFTENEKTVKADRIEYLDEYSVVTEKFERSNTFKYEDEGRLVWLGDNVVGTTWRAKYTINDYDVMKTLWDLSDWIRNKSDMLCHIAGGLIWHGHRMVGRGFET